MEKVPSEDSQYSTVYYILAWDGKYKVLYSPEGPWETIRHRKNPVVFSLIRHHTLPAQVMSLDEALEASPWYWVQVRPETSTRWIKDDERLPTIRQEIGQRIAARGADMPRSTPAEFRPEAVPEEDAIDPNLAFWPVCWNGNRNCIFSLEGPWETVQHQTSPPGVIIDRSKSTGLSDVLTNIYRATGSGQAGDWYPFDAPPAVLRKWASEVQDPERLEGAIRRLRASNRLVK